MTQTGYTNAVVDAMLGWLKSLASWILRLFNLSGGASPLKFLANNWLKLLILFLIIGVAVDLLVWLVRWRPYWIWFRKKRVVINDKNFFAREHYIDESGSRRRDPARRNWVDREYVVPSKVVKKSEPKPAKKPARKSEPKPADPFLDEPRDVFQDDLFNVNAKQKFSDKYEDEVFNVSNLPQRRKSEPRPTKKPAAKSAGKEKGKTSGKGASKKPAKAKKAGRQDDLFLEWED